VFWDSGSQVSMQYTVDTDGTVYQTLREKDVAWQAGNYWYNQRAIGIEHAGFDATGYQWYNATQYLSSAKLVAYLLTKYGIPLDHDHVMSHGTTPSPTLGTSPNHVDPGPYWLWNYYLGLINQQGVPWPTGTGPAGVITLKPASDAQPLGPNGTETPDNFNFFYLYTGPSTAGPKVPRKGSATDITDVTDNVEPAISYYVLQHQPDAAGTGLEMYQIWYGETLSSRDYTLTGTLAWLAVPPSAVVAGRGSVVTLGVAKGRTVTVYGRPTASKTYAIGTTPIGSQYVSAVTSIENGQLWYCINFNHRQAWVPASEVTSVVS
jgi:N-acetylmuramoyl-L-alanine amidase